MVKNVKEIILNKIAEIITEDSLDELDVKGESIALKKLEVLNNLLMTVRDDDVAKVPDEVQEGSPYKIEDGNVYIQGHINPNPTNPCSKCPNFLESVRTGKVLICDCTLGLPSITCNYEYKGDIQ